MVWFWADFLPEVDIVTDLVTEEIVPRRGRRAPQQSVQYAVRGEAAVRFHRDASASSTDPGGEVLVDRELINEARGPERNRDTIEIRDQRKLDMIIPIDEPKPDQPQKRSARIAVSVLVLVLLFMLAAVSAAAVARWLAMRQSPTLPEQPAAGAPEE